MIVRTGDLIVDKEGCAIVVDINDNYLRLQWNNQSCSITTTDISTVKFLVELGRWKVQQVKNDTKI